MSRLARPAARLATGSRLAGRRLAARTAAWVARGRRPDLTGWRAALGCWLRLAALAFGLYLLWRLVRAIPNLMWLLSAAWLAIAWRAGKPAPKAASDALDDAPATPPREAARRLLLDVMGEADAVHLRTVLVHLQKHGQWQARKVADLRVHLTALGVPVDRGVKVAGVPTWGVRRRDLQAPSPASTPEASTAPSTAA
ncbi:hypothetical protein [Streptomyces sp. L2]|uniref:hypothetical protein n=1 Tax=Streptomyces sp. L2 TaxID=2162665 RepID=UPI001012BBA7|nr:hypothetical protein [Streptomyces sp. L2]